MSLPRSRTALIALGSAALLAASVVAPTAAAEQVSGAGSESKSDSHDNVLGWYDITADTVAGAGASTQVTNSRTWAIAWLAAARATRKVPAGLDGTNDRTAYRDAALASAIHDALATLIPTRKDQLDTALKGTLATIPDGTAEDRGVAAGAREAAAVLKSRDADGLDPESVNAPYPVKPATLGTWQPTPPAYAPATQYGNRDAKPFLLKSPSQYRLAPPPALGSAAYKKDLAEVRAYGAREDSRRSVRQTETAQFWLGSSFTLYTEPLRVAVARAEGSQAARARLVALFHVASVDTQIATSDSKYAYERWRPVTAIRTGAIDQDQGWTPLHDTPAHPDYPSGHNTYSGSAEGILNALAGPRTAPFELTSPTAPGVTRTYTSWKRLSDENVVARIYSGIHTRAADEAGIDLGKRVAGHTLRNSGRLFE